MTRDCCDRTGRRRRRLCRTLGQWGSSGLADVIELILDKGLVIDVFVRVSLVGIELLTIDARIVVASVDTFLRFAEATHRLDLYGKGKGRAGLPDVVQGMTESGSKGKTTGVLEGVLEPAPKPAGPSSAALFQQVVAPALASASAGEIAEAADIFLRGVGADTYRELIRARLGDNAYQQLVRDAEFFFDDELRAAHEWQIDDATHITAPTLLVHGRESQRCTRAFAETVERLAQMLPAADVLEIPGLSHAKPLEDPPAIARLIAKTVNQRTGRRP